MMRIFYSLTQVTLTSKLKSCNFCNFVRDVKNIKVMFPKNIFYFNFLVFLIAFKLTNNTMEPKPSKLADFGYAFNKDGQLRKIDTETGLPGDKHFEFQISDNHATNQKNYEDLGEVITEYVYELLEKDIGLQKLPVSNSGAPDKSSFIYASKDALSNPNKLIVLIHGSGVVRAGQWARSLIINDSLKTGTQFEYIKRAQASGYGVIVTNTNDNYREINGKKIVIDGSESPERHMETVWNSFIKEAKAKHIFIVAHSYGGVITVKLASSSTDFKDRVAAVALTDSVHYMARDNTSGNLNHFLKTISRNWVSSKDPLDNPQRTSENDIPRVSAGHAKHEMTSSSCIDSVFKFFDEKLKELQNE